MKLTFTHRSGFTWDFHIESHTEALPITLIHDPRGGSSRIELVEGDGPVRVQSKRSDGTIIDVGVLTAENRALELPLP